MGKNAPDAKPAPSLETAPPNASPAAAPPPPHAEADAVPNPQAAPNEPPHQPELPAGVQMHDAARPPQPLANHSAADDARARRDPPPGWQGSYTRCGGCGDFMPGEACERCGGQVPAPPQNMMIATPPKPKE